jgi:hypothetical protein
MEDLNGCIEYSLLSVYILLYMWVSEDAARENFLVDTTGRIIRFRRTTTKNFEVSAVDLDDDKGVSCSQLEKFLPSSGFSINEGAAVGLFFSDQQIFQTSTEL